MLAASLRPLCLLGLAAALPLAGCVAPAAAPKPLALEAPVPSPPGDWPLEQRIGYWEDLLPSLVDADRDEARLRLGQLYLDAGRSVDARIAYREARLGWLSAQEEAQAEYGLALSYLLEGRPEDAHSHLLMAEPGLAGPELDECRFLLEVGRGTAGAGDPALLARLERYLPEDALVAARPAKGPGPLTGVLDVTRPQWHARGMKANHDPMTTPWRITVHHSAEPIASGSLAATKAEVRRIQQFHQDGRGWADIGYHFLVDREGRVVEGRPLDFQGAHAFGDNNIGNIGICLLGNFAADTERGGSYAVVQSVPAAQLAGLEELVETLRSHYGIARGEVHGHSEMRGTECPGPFLMGWVKRYRAGA
jgi:hypothetical protein